MRSTVPSIIGLFVLVQLCGCGGDNDLADELGPATDAGDGGDGGTGGDGQCIPDPPQSCWDLGATEDEIFLGCCGSDGNAYWCTNGDYISFDDCSEIGTGGCCFETYHGKPAYVCCGTGD